MNRLRYIIFSEFAKGFAEAVQEWLLYKGTNEIKQAVDEYKLVVEQTDKLFTLEDFFALENKQRVIQGVYGYYVFASEKASLKDSIEELKSCYGKSFDSSSWLESFEYIFTYWAEKAFLSRPKIKEASDVPILLDKPISDEIKKIEILCPMVTLKSPFTIYIITVLIDLIQELLKRRVNFKVIIYRNEPIYNRIISDYLNHLRQEERFTFAFHSENNFFSTVYDLIINSKWHKIELDETSKWDIVNTRIEILDFEKRNLFRNIKEEIRDRIWAHESRISKWVQDNSCKIDFLYKDLLKFEPPMSLSYRLGEEPQKPTIYFGSTLSYKTESLAQNQNQALLLILPFPENVILKHMMTDIPDIEVRARQKVYFLSYFPFPQELYVKKRLPFYVSPRSYYEFLSHLPEREEDEKTKTQQHYVYNILSNCIRKMGYPLFNIKPGNFNEIMHAIGNYFKRVDDELCEYIRYIA